MAVYLAIMRASARSRTSDVRRAAARIGLWVWAVVVVAFLWIPLLIMGVYAFNASNVQSWPIPGFTRTGSREAWHD